MAYPLGTVLLMPLTFTDASGTKPRPALVINDSGDDDLLVAPITSRSPRSKTDVVIENWSGAGLRLASTVRLGKLNTIARSVVIRRLGQILPADEQMAREVSKELFHTILYES